MQHFYIHLIGTVVPNFAIFFIVCIFIFKFFLRKCNIFLYFHMILAVLLLITSFFFFLKLIISIACSLKYSQNFFMKSLYLYIPCLFSMLLNDDVVDIEKPDKIFVVDEFSKLFLHQSSVFFKDSKSA